MTEPPLDGGGDLAFFFDESPDLLAVVGADGRWLRVNASFHRALGWAAADLVGRPWLSLFHPDDAGRTATDTDVENRVQRADGSYCRVNWTIARESGSGCIRVRGRCGSQEVTNAEVGHFETLFRELGAQLPEFIWVRDAQTGTILYVNEGWERATGRVVKVGEHFSKFFAATHPDDLERASRSNVSTPHGGFDDIIRFVHTDGSLNWMHVRTFKIRNAAGEVYRVGGVGENITKHVLASQALATERDRLQQIVRVSHIGIFDHDHATGEIYWSPELRDIYGWREDEKVWFEKPPGGAHRTATDVTHPGDRDRVRAEIAKAHQTGSFETEYRVLRDDGEVRWLTTRAKTFFAGEGERRRPVRTIGATLDITERKQAEAARAFAAEALRESLREKELLLREVHHRVKNNLQIIASLLHFQAKKVKDPEDLAAFTEGRDRLRSMILVHEKLYQSEGLTRIDFGGYLQSLVGDLQRSYSASLPQITMRVTADGLALPIEPALACGMIVCELVTNVFKYAFPGGRSGEAQVCLSTANGQVTLMVGDNGVGMPPGFDPDTATTFGWQMIRNLAAQMDGRVVLLPPPGTRVAVSFPRPEDSR